MNLGETIYRLRTERNLSQGDLADALDVSRQSISKWETNTSTPELDKLVRLSQLFGVTLDELVTGTSAPERPAPSTVPPAPPAQPAREGISRRELIGIILLCFAGLVWLLITIVGDILSGLLFASPFLLCGVICLVFRRNVGLWCAWALFFAVNVYLRFATGISWGMIRFTSMWEPSLNYMRLAFAWLEFALFLFFPIFTAFRLRKKELLPTKRRLISLAVGFIAVELGRNLLSYGLTALIRTSGFIVRGANLLHILIDWAWLVLLAVLLTRAARMLYTHRSAKKETT